MITLANQHRHFRPFSLCKLTTCQLRWRASFYKLRNICRSLRRMVMPVTLGSSDFRVNCFLHLLSTLSSCLRVSLWRRDPGRFVWRYRCIQSLRYLSVLSISVVHYLLWGLLGPVLWYRSDYSWWISKLKLDRSGFRLSMRRNLCSFCEFACLWDVTSGIFQRCVIYRVYKNP